MKLFYTTACEHLASTSSLPMGKRVVKRFSDGELYVKITEEITNQEVWLVGSTSAPAENIMEVLFMLNALHRAGARISLLLTYFGYARQDRALPGEALSAEVLCRMIDMVPLQCLKIVHLHNPAICDFLAYQNCVPYDFFYDRAQDVDAIVAPDKGAVTFARQVAEHCKKPLIQVEKIRSSHEHIESIHIPLQSVYDRVLIVDDMIATGETIISVSRGLQEKGVKHIRVAATHGVFSEGSYESIEQSSIDEVFVTDTLIQREKHPKINVVKSIAFLEKYIG